MERDGKGAAEAADKTAPTANGGIKIDHQVRIRPHPRRDGVHRAILDVQSGVDAKPISIGRGDVVGQQAVVADVECARVDVIAVLHAEAPGSIEGCMTWFASSD